MHAWTRTQCLRSVAFLSLPTAALWLSAVAGCSESVGSGGSGESVDTDPCGPDEPCPDGYTCISGSTCGETFTCCWHAGDIFEPCLHGEFCNDDDLACVFDGEIFVCVPTGGVWEPCRPDGGCDAELECQTALDCFASEDCCVPVGEHGEQCPAQGSCDDGLVCVERSLDCSQPLPCGERDAYCFQPRAGSVLACCQALGEVDAPCHPDGTCNEGLLCVADRCTTQ